MTMMSKSYRGVLQLKTFEDRFEYLSLAGKVGEDTFGQERYLNQMFYHSPEWKKTRQEIILRDNGCDLCMIGHEIYTPIHVHHIIPITIDDIENFRDVCFDPENLICVSHQTHNAIHYGSKNTLPKIVMERRPGDTCLWGNNG